MNYYPEQTKKKPLIQYKKVNFNQPPLPMKEKLKKDKSVDKQNHYEHQTKNYQPQTKKFKDFNQSKYATQYHQNQNIYATGIPTKKQPGIQGAGSTLAPSNLEFNNKNMNKNMTFQFVKNNQKSHLTNETIDTNNNNPIISVNINFQNTTSNLDFKKNPVIKYQAKPMLKTKYTNQRNHPGIQIQSSDWHSNQSVLNQNQRITNTQNERPLKIQQQKRRINYPNSNPTQRYMQRGSILDRTNPQRNIQKSDRNQMKDKFKKVYTQKFTSPIDADFICNQQLDLRPTDKKPSLYEKKLSQKNLSGTQMNSTVQLNLSQIQGHGTTNTIQNHLNLNQPQQMIFNQPQNLLNQPSSLNQQRQQAKKIDKKPIQYLKEIKDFELKQEQINSVQCTSAINVLFQQQSTYMVDPTYLEKNQKTINWQVRAILLDWMRQLSHQYTLKRDTYHLAVVLIDKFLCRKPHIQKQAAQVIGATTLFIASKLQELQCRPSQSFADSTQGICSAKDIQNWQLEICKTLQFNLNPPTISSLANRIMTQWDKYIDQVDYAMHHLCFEEQDKVYFKKLDKNSYRLFRQLMQFIDCVILDIQTAQYKPIMIVISSIYLIAGNKVGGFQYEQIYQVFPRVSHYLLDQSNYFNNLFESFISSTFGLTLIQILPSVQYMASFFNLNLTYEKPLLEENEDDLQQMNLEEYCSYQTYNRHMLKTVTSRFRGILNTF